MVIKKSFILLVATKTIPVFVVVPIISDHGCSSARQGCLGSSFKLLPIKFPKLTNFRNIFVWNCPKYNGIYENRIL